MKITFERATVVSCEMAEDGTTKSMIRQKTPKEGDKYGKTVFFTLPMLLPVGREVEITISVRDAKELQVAENKEAIA
jgi:hypothetical protein